MAGLSPERRAALAKEEARNSRGSSFFTMKGKTRAVIRLLPLGPEAPVAVKSVSHFLNNRSFTCPLGTHGRPGVIATAIKALRSLEDQEAQELAEALDKSRRTQYLMKVIDREVPDTVQVFRSPYSVYHEIFNAMAKDGDALDDAEEGNDVRISKEGEGINTEYSVRILSSSTITDSPKATKKLLEAADAVNLEQFVQVDEAGAVEALKDIIPKPIWKQIAPKVEALVKHGDDSDGDEDEAPKGKAKSREDDDEAPAPKRRTTAASEDDEDDAPKPKSKAKAAAEDDDEDAPKPKSKAKSAPADDGDEDDAPKAKSKAKDDDDDEDDAPKPKRPAARATDDDDDDDAPKPKAKTRATDDDDEDAPKPKAKSKPAPADDDDEAPSPKVKSKAKDDDDDEDTPKRPTARRSFRG